MSLTAVLAAALALAPSPSPGSDPVALAALRAQAHAVIRAASAQSHFVDDTRWDLPAVRHRDSGLRCLFQPNDPDNRIVYIGGITGGGGMGCQSRPAGFQQSLEAIRMAPGETLESVFAGSVLNITFQRPEARPYEGARTEVRVEPGPGAPPPAETRSARYVIGAEGSQLFSLVSVAVIDGWYVRQTMQAPADRAEEADMLAGVVMSTTLLDLAERAKG